MTNRMAIYMQDVVDIREELELARYMEEREFSEIWQGDNRLARDCIVLMSAFLTYTKRLRVGSPPRRRWRSRSQQDILHTGPASRAEHRDGYGLR